MIRYEQLKKQPKRFLALTGLTLREFREVLPVFGQAYEARWPMNRTQTGHQRQRGPGGGRTSALPSVEDKLLFLLVYLKTYPLQVVQGELFGLSQSRTNYWLHRLLPVLQAALDELGVMPERKGDRFAQSQPKRRKSELIIDGTERRRQRPKQSEKQALHYSGKKKAHSDKNLVITNRKSNRIEFLSPTYPGRVHDKKVADQEAIAYPDRTDLYRDTAFQGYEPRVQHSYQPKKNRAGKS